jgi:hypothetical protein
MINNTTGSGNNVAVGHQAMLDTTDGDTNTVVGSQAFMVNVSGDRAVAVGYEALRNSNVNMDTFNAAVGYQSGRAMTTGYFNTVLGGEAGKSITTAVQNTCVGTSAGNGSITVYSNNTCLGYNAQTATNAGNSVTLGDSNISSLRCNTTSISSLSDVRDKTEIVSIPVGLDFINTLRPVKFKWQRRTPDQNDGKIRAGFIAQELQEAQKNNKYLNLVLEDDPNKLEASPANLIPVLVKAIQELSVKVTALEAG